MLIYAERNQNRGCLWAGSGEDRRKEYEGIVWVFHYALYCVLITQEKEMATPSSTLAWRIPWMEEPGGLQSTGSQSRTRLSDSTLTFTHSHGFE